MPRRLPVRPAKVFGNFFVLIVLCLMSLIYYVHTFVIWIPKAKDDARVIALLIIHNFFFVMLVWSFFQSMTTDPGQVPVFWGFHLGDNENKRRRYCLMCNVFKPERCHHCSACNRCVLNMDHHCPWINNCVGFWNRKYFLLLLVYVMIMTYLNFFSMLYEFIQAIKWGFDNKFIGQHDEKLTNNILIMIAFIMNFIVACLMTAFLKFHVMLATDNKTTIENLDKLGRPFNSPYDVGGKENWKQIFGTNPWLYAFPIFCGSGKPVGDGIYWPTVQSQQEMANRQNQRSSEQQPGGASAASLTQTRTGQPAGQQQQFAMGGQQFQNRAGNQNVPPGMVVQNQQQNVQMIGNSNSNLIQYNNQNPQGNPNSRQDLNQRIFQNQGRAYQLQQQLNQQQQMQSQGSQPQQQNANYGNISQSHSNSRGVAGQGSSGQVNPKKKRAPVTGPGQQVAGPNTVQPQSNQFQQFSNNNGYGSRKAASAANQNSGSQKFRR